MADAGQEEEQKADPGSEEGADEQANEVDSDEEDSNMIPDEKPDGADPAAAGDVAMGDSTALEMDLLAQINTLDKLESDE